MEKHIKKLINCSDMLILGTYDFKNEAPWEDVRKEDESLEKFLMYRQYNKVKGKFDCDNSNGSCSLSDNIYSKLWGWSYSERNYIPIHLKEKLNVPWERMGSDTMNSFSTTYAQALKILPKDHNTLNNNSRIQMFAGHTHSIGNFTLIPFKLHQTDAKSFNQYRGANFGKYFVYDYFDLSLKLIKENICEAAFKRYIDTFYLDGYVDSNYDIIPLFKRHEEFLGKEKLSLENPKKFLPESVEELNEYLDNVIIKIENRSNRIVEQL